MPELVAPHGGRRLHVRDDHMPERDRAEATSRQDEIRQAAIAHVEEAAVPSLWTSEREQTQEMANGVRVMRDENAAEGQGMVATTSSTAARTCARVVTAESKRR